MSKYLLKYKGRYRIKPNLDQFTNDLPRDSNGNIDASYDDIYIACANGAQIYHYGRSILVGYIPTLGRGHNVLIGIAKRLNLIGEDSVSRDYEMLYSTLEKDGTIFDIVENDAEIEFKFHAKHISLVAEFLKPKTAGADISPFSPRNLPRINYTIPMEDMEKYKEITASISRDDKLLISHITNAFLRDILSKDRLYKTISIREDMRKMMLKGKEYIHCRGYWDKYLRYLEERLHAEEE